MPTEELLTSPDLLSGAEVVARASRVFAPPPDLTQSEWADSVRMLSTETSAQVGNWRNDNAPYTQEPMDCCSDALTREVTLMWCAQSAKTEAAVLNTIGYRIDQDPCSILVLMEDDKKAQSFSKERLTSMISATPELQARVSDGQVKSRHKDNTITYKRFPGGYVAIAGAGSEAALSSRPIRVLIMDEVDKYKSLKAGDPEKLAIKRTATFFWNKKIIRSSTPRDKGTSRIEKAYHKSDMRKFHVPCPHCGHEQVLRHERLKWVVRKDDAAKVSWAWYECEQCDGKIEQYQRRQMLRSGKWKAERPFDGHAGFWLNALYPLWVSWKEYAEEAIDAARPGNVEGRKTFVNEWRAETWDPGMAADVSIAAYIARLEDYKTVPMGAGIITIGIDIQKRWIEAEVKAWGPGRESWGIDHTLFPGSPHLLTDTKELPEVWQRLDEYLSKTWEHESGALMTPLCVCIDMGYLTDEVLKFCKPRRHRNVFPTKGMQDAKHPLIGRPNRNNRLKALYFPIGPNSAKQIVFANLETEAPGPGYMHWTKHGNYDEQYFDQLLRSEAPETVRNITVYKKVSSGVRNEGLDLNVLCLAGFEIMRADPKLFVERYRKLAENRVRSAEGVEAVRSAEGGVRSERQKKPLPRKPGWVTGWRGKR